MKRELSLVVFLIAAASVAQGQVTYCRDIGHGKTYCSGGTIIHRNNNTAIITHSSPPVSQSLPSLPNPLQQNNALPTLNAPYTAAGTQGTLPVLPIIPTTPANPYANPALQGATVIVAPAAGSRICHQFGTTLVCN